MRKMYSLKLTTIALALMFGAAQAGAEELTIKLETAGTLEAKLGAQSATVTKLTLSGPMNKADFDLLKKIGKDSNLASLNLKDAAPDGDSIPEYALAGAKKINALILPTSITKIGKNAFTVLSISSIEIPAKVTEIGSSLFSSSLNTLTNITVAAGSKSFTSVDGVLYSLDKKRLVIFPYYKSADGSYTVLDGVTHIAPTAFESCKLTNVILPASVEIIEDHAFNRAGNLKSVSLENVKVIGFAAFMNAALEGTVKLPKVTTLGSSAFTTTKITEVTIGDDIKSIGESAFEYCESLVKITIGKNVNEIGKQAFYRTKALKQVYCYAATPPTIVSVGFGLFSLEFKESGTLYVPVGSKAAYQAAAVWKEVKNIVETNPTGIEDTELADTHIYATVGAIVVKSESAKVICIYNARGALASEQQITSGMQTIALTQGIYYVSLDHKKAKAVAVQ